MPYYNSTVYYKSCILCSRGSCHMGCFDDECADPCNNAPHNRAFINGGHVGEGGLHNPANNHHKFGFLIVMKNSSAYCTPLFNLDDGSNINVVGARG